MSLRPLPRSVCKCLPDYLSYRRMPVLKPVRPPTLHRFSVAEYHRMAETGIIHRKARVELLDGEIIDMSTPLKPPTTHKFTAAEYRRMAKTGIIYPKARVELLD